MRPNPRPQREPQDTARRWARAAAASLAFLALVSPAFGQAPPAPAANPQPLAPLEGRQIREITLRRLAPDGRPIPGDEGLLTGEIEQLVRNQLRSRVGNPYSTSVANSDIERLSRLGQFELAISEVVEFTDSTVRLSFFLKVQPIIQDVQVVGNRALGDQDIREIVLALVGTPVNADQIKRYSDQIEQSYHKKGYYGAHVSIDQKALSSRGVLIFRVREGRKTTIEDVRFEGNLTFSPRELSQSLRSASFTLFGSVKLDEDDLSTDIGTLTSYYKDRGYFDARVDKIVEISPDGQEAIVTFVISEGPVYTLGTIVAVHAEGDEKVLSEAQILGLMTLKPGGVYGKRDLDRSVQAVQDALWTMGYVDATVERRELRDEMRPVIDLRLDISEGKRYRAGEVLIRGNDITQQRVPRRDITIQPGRPLDRTQERETQRRLDNSRIFAPRTARITIQPPSEDNPDYRDVLVEVRETNTGEFQIGGTVDSDGGLAARIAVNQRNFNIDDTPDTFGEFITGNAFRGGGQVFSMAIVPGDRAQTFSIGLTEPSLAESDYQGRASLLFRRRVFSDYDELRYGGNVALSRRFGSRWTGSLPVRVQWTELNDIDPASAVDYFEASDLNLLTGVGASLNRSTIDSIAHPSKGTITELSFEQTGLLGGKYSFSILRAEHKTFLPVVEDVLGRRTVLQLATKAAYIPQDTSEVPVFERFYLGGQSFRGFGFRGIGPRGIRNDNGQLGSDNVGGNFSFFLGAELQQPVYEDVVAFAFFVDTGTVNPEFSFDDYRASVGVGLRIAIPQLSPVPLAFDFGFPVLKEPTDDERLFTFSIDLPFN